MCVVRTKTTSGACLYALMSYARAQASIGGIPAWAVSLIVVGCCVVVAVLMFLVGRVVALVDERDAQQEGDEESLQVVMHMVHNKRHGIHRYHTHRLSMDDASPQPAQTCDKCTPMHALRCPVSMLIAVVCTPWHRTP